MNRFVLFLAALALGCLFALGFGAAISLGDPSAGALLILSVTFWGLAVAAARPWRD